MCLLRGTSIAAFAALSFASTASAATLTATSTGEIESTRDFTIEFTDADSDNLFSLEEIDTFSGFSVFYTGNFPRTYFLGEVVAVPAVEGISSPTSDFPYMQYYWAFRESAAEATIHYQFDWWTYSLDLDVTPVPLPASALLILSGLLGFGALRRLNTA